MLFFLAWFEQNVTLIHCDFELQILTAIIRVETDISDLHLRIPFVEILYRYV